MEQGIIFTEDKKDIEVFFLKPQGSFSPHPSEPSTWIVNDPETAQALIDDNKDCCEELLQETDFLPPMEGNPHNLPWAAFNEQDVNENSAGGGAHDPDWGEKGCSPCPVGHKGHQGVQGSNATVYDAILDVVKRFENSQLNIASETAQEILAMSIETKVKDYYK